MVKMATANYSTEKQVNLALVSGRKLWNAYKYFVYVINMKMLEKYLCNILTNTKIFKNQTRENLDFLKS